MLSIFIVLINFRDIDEIVLSYVVGILQDLASNYSEGDEESFDVDAFYEMLTAYMPETSNIPSAELTEWMFGLVKTKKEAEDHYNSTKFSHIDLTSLIEQSTRGTKERKNSTGSSGSSRITKDNSEFSDSSLEKKRTSRFSENSDGGDGYDVSLLGSIIIEVRVTESLIFVCVEIFEFIYSISL